MCIVAVVFISHIRALCLMSGCKGGWTGEIGLCYHKCTLLVYTSVSMRCSFCSCYSCDRMRFFLGFQDMICSVSRDGYHRCVGGQLVVRHSDGEVVCRTEKAIQLACVENIEFGVIIGVFKYSSREAGTVKKTVTFALRGIDRCRMFHLLCVARQKTDCLRTWDHELVSGNAT